MIIEVIGAMLIFVLIFLAVYLVYKVIRTEIDTRRAKIESVTFLKFNEAKVIILDHAEKLSRVQDIAVEEAIMIVLSSDYLPGVGQLSVSADDLVSPPIQSKKRRN